jgi:GT2 family glycosyltransferase
MGGLSEDYFHYFEDNDFFIRARRMGVKMRFVASAKVWHRGGASMGEGGMRWYYMTRNKQILLHKFGKVNHFANMKFFLSCRNWFVRKGIVDYYLHKWGNQQ